jgi:predicted component of type VI protein secretion system
LLPGESKLCIDDTTPGEFKLYIDDNSVSRVHAVLVHKGNDVFLYDMSSNGTLINGTRMPKEEYVKLKLGDTMLFGRHTKQFKLSLALSGGAAKAKSSPSPKGNARSEQAAQPLSPSTDGAEVEREKTVTRSTPSSLTHSSKKVASDRNQTDETSAQDKEISGPGKAKLVEPHIKTGQMDTEIPPKKARMSPSKSPASEALIARHGDAAAIVEPDRKNEKAASSTSAADVRYSVYLLH